MKSFLEVFFQTTIKVTSFFIVIGIIIIGCINWLLLAPATNNINRAEYFFAEKVKNALLANNKVKVSTLHQGNWIKVCSYSDLGLSKDINLNAHSNIIINNADPLLLEDHRQSALVFFYPNKQIEIYKITPDFLSYGYNGKDNACLEKKAAFLELRNDSVENQTTAFLTRE